MGGSLSEMTLPVATGNRTANVLVVDDDASVRRLLSFNLSQMGYQVTTVESGEEALTRIAEHAPDLILLDVMLPGIDGLETLRRLRAAHPDLPVVVLAGNNNVETAVEAMKLTANDFITKPVDIERLQVAVRNGLEFGSLSREIAQLRRELSGRYSFTEIVGAETGLRDTLHMLEKVLPTDLTVLLTGESGTGKELFARAIHYEGPRKVSPFVTINCAALPESLLENELFGYERGALGGAGKTRAGKFEQADGGTLFLDEIGAVSPALQAKLLRALQDRVVTRVGGSEAVPVDVRVICATNRDLSRMVEQGLFREDLYYRISIFPIAIPALRQRPEDIPLLVKQIIRESRLERSVSVHPIAMSMLEAYRWPGNVRELQNAVRRALVLSGGETIRPEHLPPNVQNGSQSESARSGGVSANDSGAPMVTLDEMERQHIMRALETCHGNLSLVSRTLDIGRTTLYRKLQRYGVQPRETA
ncbi:MAG: sigma-54 dependent transcriptional regulator [Acidobacteriota bacterium]